ncbi:hypothetical protein [Gymnodinialimonas ceratoperidinii]|uniref:Uncharacterized protein n=1 Tax=Gymnodinialimonas ceratoperidinii TaxID=2856823 RepID=A0A8F6TXW7_9RHOB|nr:hypothetical protein [Gymnodinialimonas ceratoperidinii]QXT39737.1 hypothetical protein KYE46_00295 [Gymnodinialimonas ceratoperidinii]
MFHDLAEPEMQKIINQARADRSREMARLIAAAFRRLAHRKSSVAVAG